MSTGGVYNRSGRREESEEAAQGQRERSSAAALTNSRSKRRSTAGALSRSKALPSSRASQAKVTRRNSHYICHVISAVFCLKIPD